MNGETIPCQLTTPYWAPPSGGSAFRHLRIVKKRADRTKHLKINSCNNGDNNTKNATRQKRLQCNEW